MDTLRLVLVVISVAALVIWRIQGLAPDLRWVARNIGLVGLVPLLAPLTQEAMVALYAGVSAGGAFVVFYHRFVRSVWS